MNALFCPTGFPIPDYILYIKQQFQIKNNQFYSYPPPLSFSVLSLLFASSKIFRDGPTLLFPMLLRLLFRNLSLFPPCNPYRSSPLLPIVCSRSITPIHFLRSIPSVPSPLHFPPCLWIFFSHPPYPLSNFLLPLNFPPKSIQSSLFSFIASSTRLLVIFISLLYIV
jgi:hypothetical protein